MDRIVISTIIKLTYGRDADAEYISLAKTVAQETGIALQPGKWLVNVIPARTLYLSRVKNLSLTLHVEVMYLPPWIPGAAFQRWAVKARESFYRLTREPFLQVKEEWVRCRFWYYVMIIEK